MILTIVTQLGLCVCVCTGAYVLCVFISYYPAPQDLCVCVCVSGTISGVPKAYKIVYTDTLQMFISTSKSQMCGEQWQILCMAT